MDGGVWFVMGIMFGYAKIHLSRLNGCSFVSFCCYCVFLVYMFYINSKIHCTVLDSKWPKFSSDLYTEHEWNAMKIIHIFLLNYSR